MIFKKTLYMKLLSLSGAALFLVFSCGAQGVGIGTNSPGARLQVNHRAGASSPTLRLFDSSQQSAGSMQFSNIVNASYWQVDAVIAGANGSQQALAIKTDSSTVLSLKGNGRVGINKPDPAFTLDVSGDANISGSLAINGDAGTIGQVLTSGGSSPASWANTAFANNTRFRITANEGAHPNTDLQNLQTIYNTNPADVTVSSTVITINKAGLYHFEGSIYTRLDYTTVPAYAPGYSFTLYVGGNNTVANFTLEKRNGSARSYSKQGFFSADIYITAGQIITPGSFHTSSGATISFFDTNLNLRGYLISE